MIGIGIVGCGKHAQVHALCILESDKYEIRGVCDINQDNLEQFISFLDLGEDIFQTQSYKSLLERSDVDLIIIATHTDSHLQMVQMAVDYGKNILVEKPLGVNIEQVDAIINLALEYDKLILPALEYHYSQVFENLFLLTNSEDLNGTNLITCREYRNPFFLPWFYDRSKSGGAVNDKMIHTLDLICSLFWNQDPISVFASGSQLVYKQGSSIHGIFGDEYELKTNDITDHALIVVEFSGGARASINLSMFQNLPSDGLNFYVAGNNGNFVEVKHMDSSDCTIRHNINGRLADYRIKYPNDIDINGIAHPGTKRMYELYQKALGSGKQEIFSWKILRNAHLIALASEISMREKRLIDLSQDFPSFSNYSKLISQHQQLQYKPIYSEVLEISPPTVGIIRSHLINRLIRRRNRGVRVFRISTLELRRIVRLALRNFDSKDMIFKDNLLVEMVLPWTCLYINIDNGEVKVMPSKPSNFSNKVSLTLTEEGYVKLARGASLNRLYIAREIKISGAVDIAKQYQELFVNILKEIRQFLKR